MDGQIFMNHWRVPHKNFGTWDQKFWQTHDTWLSKNFSKPEHFRNTRFPYENFRYCETKKINKIVTPYYAKIFWYQNLSETQKGSPTSFLGGFGRTISDGKRDTPFLSITFSVLDFFLETQKGSPKMFSGDERQKFSDGKMWQPPSYL